MAVLIGSQFMV